MGGAADKAGNRFERRWALLALLDVLAGTAQSLQVEVPGEEGAGAEFQVMADGVPVWHQVKRQQARGPWTIASLANGGVLAPWWPKIQNGGRFVFVSSTSAQELAELVERASAAESWQVFDKAFLASASNRERFERLRRAWGDPPGAAVYAALKKIDVRQIGESDLTNLVQARLAALVNGPPSTAMAVLEQFIDDSTHRRLTAQEVGARLAEHGLQRMAETEAGRPGREHGRGSGSIIQVARGSGNGTVTQVAGDYYNIQAPKKTGSARKTGITPFRLAAILTSSAAVLVAAVVTAVMLTTGPGSSNAQNKVADDFARAVGHLSSNSIQLRRAAISELNSIVEDAPARRPQVIDQLVVFLSKNAARGPRLPAPGYDPAQLKLRQEPDLQDALTVLARWHRPGEPLMLRGLDLSGAVFPDGLQWPNVDLTGTYLVQARLRRADLDNAKLGCRPGENCGDRSGAALLDADMAGADLHGSWLGNAALIGAILDRAELGDASMQGVNLRGARLSGTRFDGVDLRGVSLSGVDLSGVVNLGSARLSGATADNSTRWPPGFNWRNAGLTGYRHGATADQSTQT
jgi:uncharacterized protein YjbI with pentapeptide repeats